MARWVFLGKQIQWLLFYMMIRVGQLFLFLMNFYDSYFLNIYFEDF